MAQRGCDAVCGLVRLARSHLLVEPQHCLGRALQQSRGRHAAAGAWNLGKACLQGSRTTQTSPGIIRSNATSIGASLLRSEEAAFKMRPRNVSGLQRACFSSSSTTTASLSTAAKKSGQTPWGVVATAAVLCPGAAIAYVYRDELQQDLKPLWDRLQSGIPAILSGIGGVAEQEKAVEPLVIAAAQGPSSLGFAIFSFALSMWVYAQFLPPLALYLWYKHSSYVLLVAVVAYHAYRSLASPDRFPAFQSVIARFFQRHPYFQEQLVVLDNPNMMPEPSSRAMLSYHPHGVLTCGSLLNGMLHPVVLESKPVALVGSGLFGIAFLSDLLYWFGFKPWTKATILGEMSKGENLLVMPGGFEEASCYKRGTHRTYIKDRKGWIKQALQHGYRVYPVYTFGEERTYWTWLGLMKYRLLANRHQIPGAVFWGKWCTWLPANDLELVTVIGAPLELPLIQSPTREDVSKYHALYVEQLRGLFDKYKGKYATDPDAELEVVGPEDFGLMDS